MELMGAQTLQRLAAENDARGHRAPGTKAYFKAVREKGLREAFRERDGLFGDSLVRVGRPEIRDEKGFLIDD
jgi:enoyl-CoA hydratase